VVISAITRWSPCFACYTKTLVPMKACSNGCRLFAHFTLRWFRARALWRKMNSPIERHDFLVSLRPEGIYRIYPSNSTRW